MFSVRRWRARRREAAGVAAERIERQRRQAEIEASAVARLKRYATMDSDQWLIMAKHIASDPNFIERERLNRLRHMIDARIVELGRRLGDTAKPDGERARYAMERHWLRHESRRIDAAH